MDYVPQELQRLYEIVGQTNFVKIQKEYGGELLYIPMYKNTQERNKKILDDFYYNDLSTRELSKKYNLSMSMINKIIKARLS